MLYPFDKSKHAVKKTWKQLALMVQKVNRWSFHLFFLIIIFWLHLEIKRYSVEVWQTLFTSPKHNAQTLQDCFYAFLNLVLHWWSLFKFCCSGYHVRMSIFHQFHNFVFDSFQRINSPSTLKKSFGGIIGRLTLLLPLLKFHVLKHFSLILVSSCSNRLQY